jgi:hypothetical protein
MAQLKITEVTVSRLKAGPKQYENERLEVRVAVPSGKTAAEAVAHGRAFIAKQFGETPSEEAVANARAIIAQAEAAEKIG